MIKIIEKPWGSEKIWAHTEKYVGKLIHINSGHRLSLQFHKQKEETIFVIDGKLTIETLNDEKVHTFSIKKGECFHVYPTQVHRFCAYDEDVILVEVSTPEIEDVIRLEDDYNRS